MDSRSSIVIYDAAGRVVRELLHAAPRSAGSITEHWDGLDDDGRPVPPGNYNWKQLATQGLCAEYLLTLGTNRTPPWQYIPGNHNGVAALATDAGGVYLAAGVDEGHGQLAYVTWAGTEIWRIREVEGFQGGVSLALNAGKLYMLQQNGRLRVFDAATGAGRATWDIIRHQSDRTNHPVFQSALILDFDARGGQFVASYANHDMVRWFRATGVATDSAAVTAPKGIAIHTDGRVLVISQGAVMSIRQAGGAPETVIPAHALNSPWRLMVDPTDGDILVAENADMAGSGSGQQVKRFSSTGTYLASYGRAGGRSRNGPYDPSGFANVTDIAADGSGGFLAAEPYTAPRRTVFYDASGARVKEWYGGQMYANLAAPDPADPRSVWIDSHWGSVIKARVNYDTGTWQVLETYVYEGRAGLFPGHQHGTGLMRPIRFNGRMYLARSDTWPAVLMVDEAAHTVRAVSVTALNVQHYYAYQPPLVKSWISPGSNEHSFIWTDSNHDEVATKSETRFFPTQMFAGRWFVGDDLTYYVFDKYTREILKYTPTFQPDGVPVYPDWPTRIAAATAPASIGDIHENYNHVWEQRGHTWLAANLQGHSFGQGAGARWSGNRVAKFDSTGRPLWIVGRHAASSNPPPGQLSTVYRIAGVVHGSVVVADADGSMMHVYDPDGLWIGRLLENPNLTVAPKSAYELSGENFGGALFEQSDGSVLFFGSGQNATPVYRITGWDQFSRQSGSVTVTSAQAAQFRRNPGQQTPDGSLQIPYIGVTPHVWVDGDIEKYRGQIPRVLYDGARGVARVYTGWHQYGLSVLVDVDTDTPWATGSRAARVAFKGGSSLEVRLGAPDPNRTTATRGDVKWVYSAWQPGEQRNVVEMQQVLAEGSAAAPESYTTLSPPSRVRFDRVVHRSDIPGGYFPKPGGYRIELMVPPVAPLEFRPGAILRFDVVLALANDAGDATTVRLPLFSTDPDDKVVNDEYREALTRPSEWGFAVLSSPASSK